MQSKPNILFVVMDTCRFDIFDVVLKSGKLKNFSELIEDSIYYRNAISPSSWTTPSHVSLFTGLYPSEHKVHETVNLKQSSIVMSQIHNFSGKVLTEILKTNGYSTYGFVANPNLAPGTGFERGFDYLAFVDMFEELSELWDYTRQKIRSKFPTSAEDIINLAINFDISEMLYFAKKNCNFLKLPRLLLIYRDFYKGARKMGYPVEKAGKKIVNLIEGSALNSPFFLFVNFMEMHDPYKVGKGEFFSGEGKKMLSFLGGGIDIKAELFNEYKELYMRELALLDHYVGKIIDKLKEDRLYDNTVIIITSDHGQNFGEDHFYGHGILLSDSLIKVPLIIKPIQKSEALPNDNKYQPLTNLFKFLVRCSEGIVNPDLVVDEVAYSESFGIQEDYREMLKRDRVLIDKLERYDHRRVAVFSRGMKAIASVDDYKFHMDSVSSHDGHNYLDKYELENLNGLIKKFLGFRYESVDALGNGGK